MSVERSAEGGRRKHVERSAEGGRRKHVERSAEGGRHERVEVEPLATRPRARPDLEPSPPLVILTGNPNVGKSTLFNRLTGQNVRIGNYPGVTVERRSGLVRGDGASFELADVPGSYSLAARSPEEQIAISAVLGLGEHPEPSLCVVVVEAAQLVRNLYYVLELAELGVPLLVAVNMIDEVPDNPPALDVLESWLGVPCVATNARSGRGVAELGRKIAEVLRQASSGPPEGRPPQTMPVSKRPATRQPTRPTYPEALARDLARVAEALPAHWKRDEGRATALSLWALASIEPDDELEGIPAELRARCLELRARAAPRDIDLEIVGSRYALIDELMPQLFARVELRAPKRKASERVDHVLLHPLLGPLAFVALMLVVFQALFSWSDPAISLVEDVFAGLANLVSDTFPAGVARDFVTQGVIGGVGNVVVFLPQILLLFFFIGLLEDSGYMARVAYLMDRVMKAVGLHGRAFVPMLSGFACAVPAVLATRTMERQRDRLLTMMVIPLMTCSARLPVYGLIIAALFPPKALFGWVPVQAGLMVTMYVFSMVTTLLAAGVLGRTLIRGRHIPLLLELPPYRLPSLRGTLKMMWERASLFLREAGTVILACTVVLWALLSFPKPAEAPASEREAAAETARLSGPPAGRPPQTLAPLAEERPSAIESSLGGRLGKAIEPVIAPLGFDWKLGVGILGAFAAREVFVSTLGLVYGLDDLDEQAAPLRSKMRAEVSASGTRVYTPLVGLSLMVFFALSCQCMSTLAVVRRETRSWRWPAFMLAYMTGLAYVASFVVYQGGRLLGF